MFKFVEKKGFFYTCAIISLAIIVSLFFNYKANDWILLIFNILIAISLLGLLIFTNKGHRELMKVMLTTLFVCIIFSIIPKIYFSSVYIPSVFAMLTEIFPDTIRININGTLLVLVFIITGTLYIDHCIINFSNLPSKKAININKILVIVLIIIAIFDKVSLYISSVQLAPKPFISITPIIRYIDTVFLALTAVSVEAMLNAEKEEKIVKEIKVAKAAKAAKVAKVAKVTKTKTTTKKKSKK